MSTISQEGATVSAQQHERSAASTSRRAAPGRPAPVGVIPAEVVRISTMASALEEETRQLSLDEASRKRLAEVYQTSTRELEALLPAKLAAELDRFALPFAHQPPTQAELRVAQAQLLGWLEGLFGGIQLTVLTQQMATEGRPAERRQARAAAAGDGSSSGSYL
jgi:hypothetical protein